MSEQGEEYDVVWNTKEQISLVAHPDFSVEQQEVIRLEYFEKTSGRVTTYSAALVDYFVEEARAATDIKRQRPPEYLLAVSDIDSVSSSDELSPWLNKPLVWTT